jgi:hypothetical protein
MECADVVVLLWEYLDQELAAEEAESIQIHLSRCAGCYPAYCCDRAFLALLARQRSTCLAPPRLLASVRAILRAG